jgi:hypothetical protein
MTSGESPQSLATAGAATSSRLPLSDGPGALLRAPGPFLPPLPPSTAALAAAGGSGALAVPPGGSAGTPLSTLVSSALAAPLAGGPSGPLQLSRGPSPSPRPGLGASTHGRDHSRQASQ